MKRDVRKKKVGYQFIINSTVKKCLGLRIHHCKNQGTHALLDVSKCDGNRDVGLAELGSLQITLFNLFLHRFLHVTEEKKKIKEGN